MRGKQTYITFFIILLSSVTLSQSKYSTRTGTIDFEASVPSFEEVKARNDNVSAILNVENGEFASLALVKGFRFSVALMEEHFNENYMESTTYPKAYFKGTLEGFNVESLSETASEYMLKGDITIHGETRELETQIQIKKQGEFILVTTQFKLKPEDFKIKIPNIVSNKIAEEVFVSAAYSLSE